jgi:hypothetical protein
MSDNNSEIQIPSPEEIEQTISAMRDSVFVINSKIQERPTKRSVRVIQRNVGHLELQMTNQYVIEFGDDLSDITGAIIAGNEFLVANSSLL